jgi:hydrogenase maturation protease
VKTIIIGLGNPILGDDGVGWQVAKHVEQQIGQTSPFEVDCLAIGGISLMERLIGYERAILIDAIVTHKYQLGTVLSFPLEELPSRSTGHLGSAHDATLQDALRVGRLMGAQLPDQIIIVAVESQNVYDFSEELSESVAAAVPKAVQMVMDLL